MSNGRIGTPPDAMFTIADGRYVSQIWFLAGDDRDFLAVLFRDVPGSDWSLRYRFRYYADKQAHGSSDRKSGYGYSIPASEASENYIVGAVDLVVKLLVEQEFGSKVVRSLCLRTDRAQAVWDALTVEGWCHIMSLEPGE